MEELNETLTVAPAVESPGRGARLPSLTTWVILSLVIGLATGVLLRPYLTVPWANRLIEALDVIGTMWVNAIRMTVIPLVVPLLVSAIASAPNERAVGRIGIATLATFGALMLGVAVVTVLVAPLLFHGFVIDPDATAALRHSATSTTISSGNANLGAWFKELIPSNPVRAAADGTMLSIVVFTVAFGFAALATPQQVRTRIVIFTDTFRTVMLVLVQGVLLLAPVGVFALTTVVGARMGGVAAGALAWFVGVIYFGSLSLIIAIIAVTALLGRLSPRQFFHGAGPAMLVGVGTSSSLSALPAMIEGARDRWKIPEAVYGFVLPLSVSTLKLNSVFVWVINAYFVSLLYGLPLSATQMIFAGGYSVLFNATVPGIPAGGIIAITPLFVMLGLPLEGAAILLAINPLVDRIYTVSNVVADMAVTAIVSTRVGLQKL